MMAVVSQFLLERVVSLSASFLALAGASALFIWASRALRLNNRVIRWVVVPTIEVLPPRPAQKRTLLGRLRAKSKVLAWLTSSVGKPVFVCKSKGVLEISGGDEDKGHITIIIPAGTLCDGASVPRGLRGFVSPQDILTPAVAHDYLYATKFNRAEADWLFFQLASERGLAGWRCALGYIAVRAFGWKFWGKAGALQKIEATPKK